MNSEAPDSVQSTGLYAELLWVHSILRADLKVVEQLARDSLEGVAPAEIASRISELQTQGALWKIRVNCLQYCHLVHRHHRIEDVAVFPALLRVDPTLTSVVEKLNADHLGVATILDEIELTVAEIGQDDSYASRIKLNKQLNDLSTVLLEHLSYEEESLKDTLSQITFEDLIIQ